MMFDQYIQYIGWTCTLLCLLAFWLLRPRRKRQVVVVDGERTYREIKGVQYNSYLGCDVVTVDAPPKPVPYASARGSKPPAPWVTREEMVDLVARFAVTAGALNNRVAALEAAREHELPDGVRVLSLGGQYPRVVVAYDGELWWWKYSGRGWLNPTDGCAEDLLELPHWRELHGPEALAVYEDWKAREE